MKELFLAYDEKSKEFVTVGKISDFEITPESESDDSQATRRLKDAFSCSLTLNCKIRSGYILRALAGSESNNDRRRHHVPMKRRRKIAYIYGVSLGKWRSKKVLKELKQRGRRF